ncbi:LOW QUALITY PROTEIN: protein ripply3 [Labrus bergylta]|uniref:LOW QUALITY PROTEIN: protein ripply3 n=1 Tax=Labrus bergylta TaxID=56723 RepID=UPI003313C96B
MSIEVDFLWKKVIRMSSECLLFQSPSLVAVTWSHPVTVSSSSDTNNRQSSLWRPWLSSSRDQSERSPQSRLSCPYSRSSVPGCCSSDGKHQAFQHPVRLLWPRSKSFDYLYSDGEALLRNFPIQATISFYEETESEDEDEDWKEDSDIEEGLKQQSHFMSCN